MTIPIGDRAEKPAREWIECLLGQKTLCDVTVHPGHWRFPRCGNRPVGQVEGELH